MGITTLDPVTTAISTGIHFPNGNMIYELGKNIGKQIWSIDRNGSVGVVTVNDLMFHLHQLYSFSLRSRYETPQTC